MIREDYFTAEKNKLFYQISTKNSGNSCSSSHSNVSSDQGKKFSPPFIAQIGFNNLPTERSSIMKSSLEGGTFGYYDSHEVNSSRPSKPRLDPFKKFDNLNSSKNRNFRLSFDETNIPL